MKTSSNNTRTIERYLLGKMDPPSRFLFEARLLVDPGLRMDLQAQKEAYALIKMYHRKKLKEEVESIHQQLFRDLDKAVFKQQIVQLFKKEEK
jgi:hypothetical protein